MEDVEVGAKVVVSTIDEHVQGEREDAGEIEIPEVSVEQPNAVRVFTFLPGAKGANAEPEVEAARVERLRLYSAAILLLGVYFIVRFLVAGNRDSGVQVIVVWIAGTVMGLNLLLLIFFHVYKTHESAICCEIFGKCTLTCCVCWLILFIAFPGGKLHLMLQYCSDMPLPFGHLPFVMPFVICYLSFSLCP